MRTALLVVLAAAAGALVHRVVAGRGARIPEPERTTATPETDAAPGPTAAARPAEPPRSEPARALEPLAVPMPAPAEPPASSGGVELREGRPFLHLEGRPADGGHADDELLRRRLAELEEARAGYDRLATEARAQNGARRVAVTMWSAAWCGVCRRARGWLDARHVPYAERDIDQSAAARRDLLARNPRGSVPTFDVGGQTVIGFSEARLAQLLGAR